jgi:DNA polymerase sigma
MDNKYLFEILCLQTAEIMTITSYQKPLLVVEFLEVKKLTDR